MKADYKGKSNLFEFVLEGAVIPDALRKDIMLKTLGGFSLMMAFDGEPMPCVQCGANSHTTKSCEEGKRKMLCICGKEGHIQIACALRENPRCHASGERKAPKSLLVPQGGVFQMSRARSYGQALQGCSEGSWSKEGGKEINQAEENWQEAAGGRSPGK